jgi:hypothetical protein
VFDRIELLREDLADAGPVFRVTEWQDEGPTTERDTPRGSEDREDADERRGEREDDAQQGEDLEALRQGHLDIVHSRSWRDGAAGEGPTAGGPVPSQLRSSMALRSSISRSRCRAVPWSS